jgi:hypothetical protein
LLQLSRAPPSNDKRSCFTSVKLPAMQTALEARLARSAGWFYWIAGLSLVNAFAVKSNFQFLFGSGAVEYAPAFGQNAMIAIDAIVIGGFALFGFLAGRRHTWAFVLGMLLYAADGALYLLIKDYLPVLFHAYVLYLLFLGMQASMALNRLPVETRTMVMPQPSPEIPPQP